MPDDELLTALHALRQHDEESLDGAQVITASRPRWPRWLALAAVILVLTGVTGWTMRDRWPRTGPNPLGTPAPGVTLIDTPWLLQSVTVQGKTARAEKTGVSASFTGKEFELVDPLGTRVNCPYSLNDATLEHGTCSIATPSIAGTPPAGWEAANGAMVTLGASSSSRAQINSASLTLHFADTTLTFTPREKTSTHPLPPIQGSWRLLTVADQQGNHDVSQSGVVARLDEQYLTLEAPNRAADRLGGFRIWCRYTQSGGGLTPKDCSFDQGYVPSKPPGWDAATAAASRAATRGRVSVTHAADTMTWRVADTTLTFGHPTTGAAPHVPVTGSWKLTTVVDANGTHDVSSVENLLTIHDNGLVDGSDPLNPFDCKHSVTGNQVSFTQCRVGTVGATAELSVPAAHALRGFGLITANSQPVSASRSDRELVLTGKEMTLTFTRR
ncbi:MULTISPECIES: hypothetical protein [unclassified Luteococcus]|uniref:hypothetical protein n=1 Tax=unclassified Luteococcus TaxID=2639923 RepID=UPI00313F1726